MTKAEIKRLENVRKRSERAITRIATEIESLTLAQDKIFMESEEYYLLAQIKGQLSEACLDLSIVKNRITLKLNKGGVIY